MSQFVFIINLCLFVFLVFCRVYTPDHSYVTIRSRLSCRVGEILALVREKLQYSEDQPVLPGNLILVAVTSAGGREAIAVTISFVLSH